MSEIYLESDIKENNLKNLQTGDLVKFEADITPIIFHYGIIYRDGDDLYIYHNQATFKNRFGGGLIREDLKNYARGRKIVSIEQTGLNENSLLEMTDLLKTHKYDWINNNCEHFINNLRGNNFYSPTVCKISLGILLLAGIILYLKK